MKNPWDEDYSKPIAVAEKMPWEEDYSVKNHEKSGGILGYYKKDLPEIARGFWERTKKRAATLDAPTEFGEAVHAKPGGVLDAAVGVPERLGRLGLGAFMSAADLMGQVPFEIAAKSANRLTGGAAGKAVGGAVNTITKPIQPAIKNIGEKYEVYRANSSPGENANLDAALSGFGGLLQFGGLGQAKKGITALRDAGKITEQQVDKASDLAARKGLKFVKSGNTPPIKNIENNQKAVKVLAKYKNETGIQTPIDETETNFITDARTPPKTAEEALDAIVKTKKVIYKKYHDMAVASGDNVGFDPSEAISKIQKHTETVGHETVVNDHAKQLISEIERLRGATPEEVEMRIQDMNNRLRPNYNNTDRVGYAKAKIDLEAADALRKELDDEIMKAVGPGYQDLKNEYGALKSVENAYMHRARLQMNKAPKGFFDLTDIASTPEILIGIMTGNMAQAARGGLMKGVKEAIKWKNNPDRYIGKSFNKAWKWESGKPPPEFSSDISWGDIPAPPSAPLPDLDRYGKFYPSINIKKILPDNPALDQDFQISKIINSLKSGRSPQEVDDLLRNLSSQLPFGNPNRQQPYMLSEDLMNKLRNFKNRRILEDLQ